jgi:hypothetical protein
MAMPPIVVVVDLFSRKGDEADRVRSERSLLLLMEAMCAIDLMHLRQRPYPKLYESGVVYRREDRTENWLDIPHVLKAGWGDCEDLVFWRVAELRKAGVKAAYQRRLQVPRPGAALRARARPLRSDGER